MNELIKLLDNNLECSKYTIEEDTIYITVKSTREKINCPCCQLPSKRVHSHYSRNFQDLPIQGKKVIITINNRKIFCDNKECSIKTFSETFNFIEYKAKKSNRLIKYIQNLALNISSNRASALLKKDVLNIGKSTVCNILKKNK